MDKIQSLDLKVLLKLNHIFANWGFLNKFLAEYLTYSLPLILIALWFWPENAKKVALRAGFSVILAWPILASTIGKLVNRDRPFNSGGVQELIFHRPTVSFPSDHAAALFAVAMSFYLSGYKKLSYAMFAIAAVTCFFRVATGIHWPTDILAGVVVGLLSAWIIKLLDEYLDVAYNWLINIAKKIRLA
ncbi:TPA: phosphatase PAP2 family protein [Candidatus Berkelbacteria bacterium]|uniref:Putative undecaprenyl-diphosphatase YbjG n=1 Tax=Berkelbacteria bacterium GW2011_GWE1_39_12 TaxID=1618337 RepID=A0A0G4B2L9_9BACT|nr:MAG: putative undecaprenyl-diphosphatase YbjG [Berkelbacteria bacterium GW2011_GWE1_39_12]HBO60706.1 phosphatase PAP2 family protein [Candidatus Berkelbacteria bacterium]